jgi:PucR C-terminal helix-turn-helix domain
MMHSDAPAAQRSLTSLDGRQLCMCTVGWWIIGAMAVQLRASDVIRRIVERVDLDDFTEQVLDSFWERPEYQRFRPLREDVRAWVRWNIDLVIRWLVDGQPPTEADLERFRERARMLAANGMPPDIVPANFRRGARFAWTSLLDAAHDDERAALAESADLLFEFIDRVSQQFSETYESAGPAATISEEERRARALLARAGEVPTGEDLQLAEQIGFELTGAYRPFVLLVPSWSVERHLSLAGRLRARHLLAVAEGRRVAGLAHRTVPWAELAVDPSAVIALGRRTRRAELSEAFDDLRVVIEIAAREGRTGPIDPDDHLAELLLRRSPRLAARLGSRVYDRLDPELARTLDVLIEHDFDRGATATALPVHRNTLTNRLNRVHAITGFDADSADGRGLLWLAWLERAAR